MEKNEIMNDIAFKQQCRKYGIYWENCEVYDNVILLNTPIKDLYVIFDKNYNTIAIDKLESDMQQSKIDFAKRKYYKYCNFTDIFPFGEEFDYPFEDFTLKNIIDLYDKIEIMETNHGHSLSIKINGKWYDRESKEHENYFRLLSYIKFLGEEIKRYFLFTYHLQILGCKVPNVYEYVRNLISQINNSIDFFIENNKRPWPSYILSNIGQNPKEIDFDELLYDVIDLLLNDKGFRIKWGSPDEIEELDKPDQKSNLSLLATQLLEILDLS